MLGLLSLSLVLASPAPSPTPLKTIVTIRVTPRICQAFKGVFLPAVQRASENDILATQGEPILSKMAHDYVGSAGESEGPILMEKLRLENLSLKIEKNLEVVDAALAKLAAFRPDSKSDAQERLADLRTQLQNVANYQHQTLNLLYGLYDTYAMMDMQYNGYVGVSAIRGRHAPNFVPQHPAHLQVGVPPAPGAPRPPELYAAATDFSNNPFLRFLEAERLLETDTHKAEEVATPGLLQMNASCQ